MTVHSILLIVPEERDHLFHAVTNCSVGGGTVSVQEVLLVATMDGPGGQDIQPQNGPGGPFMPHQ